MLYYILYFKVCMLYYMLHHFLNNFSPETRDLQAVESELYCMLRLYVKSFGVVS